MWTWWHFQPNHIRGRYPLLQSIVKVYFKLNGQRLSSGLQVTYIDDHSGIYSATDGIGRGRLKALLWAGNPSYMGHHTSHHHFYSIFIPHFSQPSSFLRFRHLLTKFCILSSSIIFYEGCRAPNWYRAYLIFVIFYTTAIWGQEICNRVNLRQKFSRDKTVSKIFHCVPWLWKIPGTCGTE